MNSTEVLEEFERLLRRELTEYETRMITRAYILGLVNGVNLADEESKHVMKEVENE
jgi:hypothetical protein